jgi:hypothetical protein
MGVSLESDTSENACLSEFAADLMGRDFRDVREKLAESSEPGSSRPQPRKCDEAVAPPQRDSKNA